MDFACSALTLLVEQHEEHSAHKTWSDAELAWLSVRSEMQTIKLLNDYCCFLQFVVSRLCLVYSVGPPISAPNFAAVPLRPPPPSRLPAPSFQTGEIVNDAYVLDDIIFSLNLSFKLCLRPKLVSKS